MTANLDIDSMRAFTSVVDSGGITRASIKLNLSQSAVSHKMKRLEKKINRSLFTRSEGKMNLTADGEKLLDYARRLVRLHDEACANFYQSDLAGELRLGITEDITASGIAQILSNFSSSFPHVALTSKVSHTPELVRGLNSGEIDMALIEVFESEQLKTDHVLGRQEAVWIQAEGFVYSTEQTIPFVTYHKNCFYKAWAEQALAAIGQRMKVVFECPSIEGMINAVRTGLGIGLVNRGSMEQRLATRRDYRGIKIDRQYLPQPPSIQHVARFSDGVSTQQMDKLLELIKAELLNE